MVVSFLLLNCESKPSLQKYFVENTESADFMAVDLVSSIINTEKVSLSNSDKEALKSFEKMNILAFRADSTDIAEYDKEIKEVKAILKNFCIQEQMSFLLEQLLDFFLYLHFSKCRLHQL